MKKLVISVILIITVIVAAYNMPLIPDELADGMWSEDDFEAAKPSLVIAADRLNELTKKAMGEGYDLSSTYNLECDFGHTNVKQALLGSNAFGTSRTATWAFGTWVPRGLPYLEYSDEGRSARLRPEYSDKFLSWLEEIDSYPEHLLKKKKTEQDASSDR